MVRQEMASYHHGGDWHYHQPAEGVEGGEHYPCRPGIFSKDSILVDQPARGV